MSVQHYKNGQLSIIAGAGGIGGGGGEESFTGTKAEVEQAIAAGEIKENWTVYITDDIEEVTPGGEVKIEVLDSYDEIMTNTEEGKVAGALGVKEGFEALIKDINKTEIYDSNWNYIRFTNGRAIAWGNASFETNGYGDVGPLKYFNIGGLDIKLPISFNAVIIIPHVVYTSAGSCLQLQLLTDGSTISSVYGISATNQNATIGFNYIAVGSWK